MPPQARYQMLFIACDLCWGNSAQHLWLVDWISFIICQHVSNTHTHTQLKLLTKFPLNHLKFGLSQIIWIFDKLIKSLMRIKKFSFLLAPMIVKISYAYTTVCLGNSLTARNSSENAEKSELGAYILTNVTSCEPAWTSVIRYFPLQFDLVKMCLKFTLLLTRITTSCNGRAPENRLPCRPTSHPPSVHFLATNTIKLITTEIGQNVFSIVANVPLMLHRLPLILELTFSLIAGATSREKCEGGKAACTDGGA